MISVRRAKIPLTFRHVSRNSLIKASGKIWIATANFVSISGIIRPSVGPDEPSFQQSWLLSDVGRSGQIASGSTSYRMQSAVFRLMFRGDGPIWSWTILFRLASTIAELPSGPHSKTATIGIDAARSHRHLARIIVCHHI